MTKKKTLQTFDDVWCTAKGFGQFHFFPKGYDQSLCGKKIPDPKYRRLRERDPTNFKNDKKICGNCKYAYGFYKKLGYPSFSEKNAPPKEVSKHQLIRKLKKLIFRSSNPPELKILVPATCAEPGCNKTGVTYVSPGEDGTTNLHYCIDHNIRIKTVMAQ
ncbi:hypothetical protein LCGC14_0380880 [marine sediment metagenome]|uniref:Uncharacterized protein n=1 Tax=marine sediment metagenome TaxID=412755 RepID=A0A0F9TKQ1_9ZZZZ